MKSLVSTLALATALAASPVLAITAPAPVAAPQPALAPTPADADAFVAAAEAELLAYSNRAQRVVWIQETYINEDTEALAAEVGAEGGKLNVRLALEAAKYDKVPGLSPVTARKLNMLRTAITMPAPSRDGAAEALAAIGTNMAGQYGKGKGTLRGQPISGSDIEAEMGTNRNPDELREMWTSWHDNVGAPMKDQYVRQIGLANEGARELGYKDVGALWRSNYDMSAEDFSRTMDKLWGEVKPLYDALHCYTRAQLNAKYGDAVQPKTGPIRADLLGNMWGQEWGGIYDIVAPKGAGDIGYDIGALLDAKGTGP
ncbi:MAG: hypothetical protein RLZZ58_563, partial [Pseudomonadota bacterium]